MNRSVGPSQQVICIGTGPPMLFEGLRLAANGAAVTFLDRADTIGGGWRTRDLFGVSGVEVGVHLIENRRTSNRALASVVGRDRLARQAGGGLFAGRRIPLAASRLLLHSGLVLRSARSGDLDRALHATRMTASALLNAGEPLLYPAKGFAHILTGLRRRLEARGAVFEFDVEIDRIEITDRGVAVTRGSTVTVVDQVLMSSRAHAPIAGLERLWTGLRRTKIANLVLAVEGRPFDFEGYVEVLADSHIKRIRDLTPFYPDLEGRSLAVVQIRGGPDAEAAQLADAALRRLSKLGLMQRRAEILAAHIEVFVSTTLPGWLIRTIERRCGPAVQVLRTVDFADRRHSPAPKVSTP